jgi:rubrerythrin
VNAREQIVEILRKAYQIELDGYTFYAMTAEKASKPAVKELFQKLAEDEVQHQEFLRAVARRHEAEAWVPPAEKRLQTGDSSGGNFHLGLVNQEQLFLPQC